jgi:glucose-6-phosphate isomerase
MLPAALLGLDLDGFRQGAGWALQNPALASQLSAGILRSWERGEWITQLWSYSEGLRVFGEWWQQLWGESLGKKLNRMGGEATRASTPMACSGPRDQHSLVQQLMEGARDKYVLIARVKSEEQDADSFTPALFPTMPFAGKPCSFGKVLSAEARAFEKSLAESGLHYSVMQIETLNEKTIGALFMLWQMVIAQLGEHMQIDAFNQPGVESGKKHAFALLR